MTVRGQGSNNRVATTSARPTRTAASDSGRRIHPQTPMPRHPGRSIHGKPTNVNSLGSQVLTTTVLAAATVTWVIAVMTRAVGSCHADAESAPLLRQVALTRTLGAASLLAGLTMRGLAYTGVVGLVAVEYAALWLTGDPQRRPIVIALTAALGSAYAFALHLVA